MYFAHFVMMLVLFGCSLGKSFVLQSSEKEPAAATGSAVLHPDRLVVSPLAGATSLDSQKVIEDTSTLEIIPKNVIFKI